MPAIYICVKSLSLNLGSELNLGNTTLNKDFPKKKKREEKKKKTYTAKTMMSVDERSLVFGRCSARRIMIRPCSTRLSFLAS
jgi:hypothetical protein